MVETNGVVRVTRNVNLRNLNEPEESENRPFRFGLDDRVRLVRQGWCENRNSFLIRALANHTAITNAVKLVVVVA